MNNHSYIRHTLLMVACTMAFTTLAQTDLTNKSTTVTVLGGNAIFISGNLINVSDGANGNFASSKGGKLAIKGNILNNADTVLFSSGDSTKVYLLEGDSHVISGIGGLNFHTVHIETGADSVRLEKDITVADSLQFITGNLFLNGNEVQLSAFARLAGESENARAYGSSGVISTTRALNGVSENIAGLGLHVSTGSNLGQTQILRGHGEQNAADTGLLRFVQMQPTFNGGLNASITFNYFDAELNELNENQINLYSSTNEGATWNIKPGTLDENNNTITRNGTDSLGRFTAANDICLGNEPYVNLGNDTVLCMGDSFILDASGSGIEAFMWSTGATTPQLTVTEGDTFSILVTDTIGCINFDTIIVSNGIKPFTELGNDTIICTQDSITLSAVDQNSTSPQFLWSNNDTTELSTIAFTNAITDTLWVRLTNGNCVFTDSIEITVLQTPVVTLGNDTGLCQTDTLVLDAQNAGYDYAWSTGDTTQTLVAAVTSLFSVTVSIDGTCAVADTISVVKSNLSVSAENTGVQCFGLANATISANDINGAGSSTYMWSTGDTTSFVNNIDTGTYIVTVTDTIGCIDTDTTTVTQPQALVLSFDVTNANCNTGGGGSIDLTVTGGTPPYMFDWGNQVSTEDLSGLDSGNYNVFVMDANQCGVFGNAYVDQPEGFTLSKQFNNITCHDSNNASIVYTIIGGTSPFTYNWSIPGNDSLQTNLSAGSYHITVTDSNGCQKSDTTVVTNPAALSLALVEMNISCYNANNGSIQAIAAGGTGMLNYDWSTGDTTANIQDLTPGWYTLFVTDENSCAISDSIEISEPTELLHTVGLSHVSCNGLSNGSIDLSVSGGTMPYNYNWDNGATTQDLNNIAAGQYILSLSDVNGCENVDTFLITQPDSLQISSDSVQNVFCNGDNSGNINITVSGGTAPFNFQWSNASTNQNLTNVVAGTYTVTISDDENCQTTGIYTISQPTSVVLNTNTTMADCNESNGTATINISGGIAPYQILWENSGSTTHTDTALAAGSYKVLVTDSNGCVDSAFASVSNPGSPMLALDAIGNVDCFDNQNGFISIAVSGGFAPYNYTWSNGSTTQDLNNLSGGIYNLTVTDDSNCTATQSFEIEEPDSITISILSQNVTCFGLSNGGAQAVVSGGVTPYMYLWSNGSTTDSISSVEADSYVLSISDSNGCSEVDTVVITEPDTLQILLNDTGISCFGASDGIIDTEVTGGSPSYNYAWSNSEISQDLGALQAGVYTLTLTDENGCLAVDSAEIFEPTALAINATIDNNLCFGDSLGQIAVSTSGGTSPYEVLWNTGDTTDTLNELSGGNYTITLTDLNGCVLSDTFQITEPQPLAVNLSPTDYTCPTDINGAIETNISGGSTPYQFLWNTGDTIPNLNNLEGGLYTLTVTDSNGCVVIDSAEIDDSNLMAVSVVTTHISCFGESNGAIDLTTSGGLSPYTYGWSSGQINADLNNLTAGTYTVTVSDNINCAIIVSTDIVEPLAITLMDSTQNPRCSGGNNGFIFTSAQGGTGSLTFSWSNGNSGDSLLNITGGTYLLTVTDSNGCSLQRTYSLTNPQPILLNAAITNIGCGDDPDAGAVALNPVGGTTPYQYNWNTGNVTSSISGIGAGIYSVTLTDANNCTASANYNISLNGNPVFARYLSASVATSNDTIRFVNLSTEADNLWNFDDGNISTDVSPVHRFISRFETDGDSSFYYVTLTVSNATCTDSLTKLVRIENVGSGKNFETIEQGEEGALSEVILLEMQLFPVPTRDVLNYSYELSKKDKSSITITTLNGQEVHKVNMPEGRKLSGQLDLQHLAAGNYFLMVSSQNDRRVMQFVKM